MLHVNINCSNYERSKAFYEMLGFEVFWDVPPTNSKEVAAAVGMPPYKVKGALMVLKNAPNPFIIDLLEWQQPTDTSAPYPHLYHNGIARIAMNSSDLKADYAILKAAGVEILSEPAEVFVNETSGSRFFCFKDPDGTYLELVEPF
jgi:catechol 2,3-dioxygenase-like lactoylglutathione lyase family enzyme